MKLIEIKPRGTPPYEVWTGNKMADGTSAPNRDQRSRFSQWHDALASLFDMSDAGTFLTGQHIKDAGQTVVFSVDDKKDLGILRKITDTVTGLLSCNNKP